MDTRRVLIALLLSLAVLMAWSALFPPEPPPAPVPEGDPIPVATAVDEPRAAQTAPEPLPAPVESVRQTGAETELPVEQAVEAEREQTLVVETDSVRAEFSNRGAQLVSFQLEEHRNAEGGWVDLVRAREDAPYPFALTDGRGEASPLTSALFVAERQMGPGGEPVLWFRFSGAAGSAEKRFTFRADGLIDVEVEVAGAPDWGLLLGPGIRNPSPDEMEDRFSRRSAVYRVVDEVERIDSRSADEAVGVDGAGMRWVGIEDRYFLTAALPTVGLRGVVLQPMLVSPGVEGNRFQPLPPEGEMGEEQEEMAREMQAVLLPAGERLELGAYLGPKEFHRLAAQPGGLEKSVNLGVFWFMARPLLSGLRWIHDHVVQNYGWAIILMTVLIRILLFPLTHKSTVSMQKMQQLNPRVQAIRQKYRSKLKDKKGRPNPEQQRKMNEEVMAVYKAEGVNPAGGCFPMLLQIPVLFAFYNLLSAAIELRHAPWMLWIQDLSAPDPFYVLPVVMGASQFIQQRMTPSSGDPMQRRLFLLMPVFFTVLFLGFPSGLVLYWLTNNLLGIVQTGAYAKWRKAHGGEEESPKKPKGKS